MKPVILIVDDDPIILSTMNQVLSPHYKVRVANSGARALEVVITEPKPELILLDVLMPKISGFDVLEKLRGNSNTKEIPVIFVTGLNGENDEEKGIELGAVDYISKPISPIILLARVKNHITLKRAKDFLVDKNSFLEAEIARRLEENQTIQDVSIRALAHLAETRDPETGAHILRTQKYVNILAKQLQRNLRFSDLLTDQYIAIITKSAPLHDTGKVGISDAILLKQGKFTDEEFEQMKLHTVYGVKAIESAEKDINKSVEFLDIAKEIARWHHEHWDGNGYPDQISGELIPLSARLMAVADVFDALISKRVYKEAMSYDVARDIIISGRGKHFDPDITDAFISCYEQFVQTANEYRDVKP